MLKQDSPVEQKVDEIAEINKRLDELSEAIKAIPTPVDYTPQIDKLRSDMFDAFRSFSPGTENRSEPAQAEPIDEGPTIGELLGI